MVSFIFIPGRHVVIAGGHALPLHPTGTNGEFGDSAGVSVWTEMILEALKPWEVLGRNIVCAPRYGGVEAPLPMPSLPPLSSISPPRSNVFLRLVPSGSHVWRRSLPLISLTEVRRCAIHTHESKRLECRIEHCEQEIGIGDREAHRRFDSQGVRPEAALAD